ncbi:MAG: class I adenylate-forming enzyme family protein [Acidimicrobiia bacterium]
MGTLDFNALGLILPEERKLIPYDGPQLVAEVLDRAVERFPDKTALVSRFSRYTYAEIDAQANAAAEALRRLGIGKGDRVAASMANHADIVLMFLGAMRLGAIWVGVNRQLAAPEKAYLLTDSQSAVFVSDQATVDAVRDRTDLRNLIVVDPADPASEWRALVAAAAGAPRPEVEIDPFEPAAISYTSGTTGFPKGAVHSQHNMLVVGAFTPNLFAAEDMTTASAMPLTILNLMILGPVQAFRNAGKFVCMDRIDALGVAEWIRAEGINSMSFSPTMLHDLVTHPDISPDDLVSLTRPGVGGADCPPAWRDLFAAKGFAVSNGYGMTEAPTSITSQLPDDPRPPGSCGRALPHLVITVVDEDDNLLGPNEIGEICVEGRKDGPTAGVYTPMLGYWNKPAETAKALRNGRYHTGDIGFIDNDGIVTLKDRRNDMILRGGANVYPAEVERVLAQDRRLAAVAVMGVPDERLGERVVAAVQPADGEHVEPDELLARCREELARYKVPDTLLIVDSMPRNAMNKIMKRDLKALFTDTQ